MGERKEEEEKKRPGGVRGGLKTLKVEGGGGQ